MKQVACKQCRIEMEMVQIGVEVNGVSTDIWRCPKCLYSVAHDINSHENAPQLVCLCRKGVLSAHKPFFRIDMAWEPPRPYKVYQADLWTCHTCLGSATLSLFTRVFTEHFQDDFPTTLKDIADFPVAKGDNFEETIEAMKELARGVL